MELSIILGDAIPLNLTTGHSKLKFEMLCIDLTDFDFNKVLLTRTTNLTGRVIRLTSVRVVDCSWRM